MQVWQRRGLPYPQKKSQSWRIFAKVIGVIVLIFIINTLPSNNKQQLAVKSANYSTHTYTCTPSPVKKCLVIILSSQQEFQLILVCSRLWTASITPLSIVLPPHVGNNVLGPAMPGVGTCHACTVVCTGAWLIHNLASSLVSVHLLRSRYNYGIAYQNPVPSELCSQEMYDIYYAHLRMSVWSLCCCPIHLYWLA